MLRFFLVIISLLLVGCDFVNPSTYLDCERDIDDFKKARAQSMWIIIDHKNQLFITYKFNANTDDFPDDPDADDLDEMDIKSFKLGSSEEFYYGISLNGYATNQVNRKTLMYDNGKYQCKKSDYVYEDQKKLREIGIEIQTNKI